MPPLDSSESGEVEGYAGPVLSDYTGGRKRRKSGKRGKRRSSRKSKKYMKKMYRGGNTEEYENKNENKNGNENENELTENENSQGGGRRKRKGKTRKGKVSKWITHVKNFSRANKMDFRDALKNPKCKAEYHKMK